MSWRCTARLRHVRLRPLPRPDFETDPVVRRAVELYAMQTASDHFRNQGFTVKDVSSA
jgi:hypothetical protein